MAVGVAKVFPRQHAPTPLAVQRHGLDQNVSGFSAVAPRIHAQRPADRTGHARVELQPRNARLSRRLGHARVQSRRSGGDAEAVRGDLTESRAKTDDHALDAAVSHERVGRNAERGDGNAGVDGGEEEREVRLVLWNEERVGRPADAEPGVGREGDVALQRTAHLRKVHHTSVPGLDPGPRAACDGLRSPGPRIKSGD